MCMLFTVDRTTNPNLLTFNVLISQKEYLLNVKVVFLSEQNKVKSIQLAQRPFTKEIKK